MVRALTIREGYAMAAPSLLFPPSEVPEHPARDFAAEASLERLRAAATVARDRIAELDGVRVLGPEVKSDTDSVRLAIDLRDTGRDAWQVACAMAGRGFTLDAASHRVIVVRLTEDDIRDATQHRLAPRPAARAVGDARQLISRFSASTRRCVGTRRLDSARAPGPSGRPRSRAGPRDTSMRRDEPVLLQPADGARERTLTEVHGSGASSCIRGRSPHSHASRSSTSNSLTPRP